MSTVQVIKQFEERNVATEITLMVWCNRMDLVALANIKGEVSLHRLAWTKAWTLPPPKPGITVTGISWRPDGKIIAISYTSNEIYLVKVENKTVLHTVQRKAVSCLNWVQHKVNKSEDSPELKYMKNVDLSADFLPEPSKDESANLLQEQTALNVLLVGTSEGCVDLEVFGCFNCASLNLSGILGEKCRVKTVQFNEDLTQLVVCVECQDFVKLICFDASVFSTHTNELFAVALKHIKLKNLVDFLQSTISTITESWESILLEMDNKLSNYAKKVPQGGVSADFLELLTFGFCSEEMKAFLIHDLTKKGLEKFGQTIEISYTNIHKLVRKNIMKFGQNISYHLSEMLGMARFHYRYKVLGLREEAIEAAFGVTGAFLIKSDEMQQVINQSIMDYKAFFRWLYTAIIHLLEEQVPEGIPQMTQQDQVYIAEFLQNFDFIGRDSEKGFVMERLGQYLRDAPLSIAANMTQNQWSAFLAQNACVQKLTLKHNEDMSLVTQFKHLTAATENVFVSTREALADLIKHTQTFTCFRGDAKVTHINTLFCFLSGRQSLLLCLLDEGAAQCARVTFDSHDILDAEVYSATVLSVLLLDRVAKCTLLCQVPLALEQLRPVGGVLFDGDVGVMNGMPRLVKRMEGMLGVELAVSSGRKVGIVLAESRRKVRLYEMEGEDEEEEDADMTNDSENMSVSIG